MHAVVESDVEPLAMWLIGFQRGVAVASRSQVGRLAYSSRLITVINLASHHAGCG